MRLVRGVVLVCALAACGHSSTTGSISGSAEPPRWPKAGPAPVIATMSYPLELAVAGRHVWVVSGDRDLTYLANGSARIVKSFGWVHAIVADEEGVWVAADDELGGKTSALWRVVRTGEATRIEEDVKYIEQAGSELLVWRANDVFVRAASGSERPLGAALDKYGSAKVVGDLVYVASREGQVARMPLAGGAFETLGDFGDLLESFDVAGDVVYATVDRGVFTMRIPAHPGSGLGLVRHKLVENLDDPRELVADGNGGVYVLTYGTSGDLWGHSTNSDGELLHIDAQGHVTALASDFIGAGRIALSGDKVYVSDVYGGRVLMLPR